METPAATTTDAKSSFFSRLVDMDTDTKSGLMNGIQYIVLAVIPIAIVDLILKKFFTDKNPEAKGSIELLAEILGEAVLTLILLFCVHKVIVAIPTYSGTAMTRLNYSTMSLSFLITYFALDQNVSGKMKVLFSRIKDMWEGKTTEKTTSKKGDKRKNKVSVSQPLSGRSNAISVHQPSRADYIGTSQATSMLPAVRQPQQPLQPQQETNITGQGVYGGKVTHPVAAQDPRGDTEGFSEPLAANSVLGGGGSWSAW